MVSGSDLYPPSITGAPADLTVVGRRYRISVVLLFCSLLLFLLFYVGLIVGAGFLVYRVFDPQLGANPDGSSGGQELTAFLAAALLLFLVKGLFKRQKMDVSDHLEITAAEQPEFFAFLRRLCDETGAPFPYRVYLCSEVNAAVFYDRSLLSLIFPARKNLLVGLGLVNALTLDEFKAVLAHEFGHFSQSSMRLGRYVYVANGIIADIVFARDWFDTALHFWCSIRDLRISGLGWVIRGLVWIVRQLLAGAFRLINFVEAFLSREMEFHADLVAVSVTGSDSLVHALSRLEFAHESLAQAMQDLKEASEHRLYTRDLFFHQGPAAEYLRRTRQEPQLGTPPALPADRTARTQVFTAGEDSKPSMWASHPSNHDREQNAKRHYLRSVQDPRSPWILFRNPEAIREAMTRKLYELGLEVPKDAQYAAPETVQAFIEDEHLETTYNAQYHGLFDSRLVEPGDLDELIAAGQRNPWPVPRLSAACVRIYDGELKEWLEAHQERQGEEALLEALKDGELKPREKSFPFRDQTCTLKQVPELLQKVEAELEADHQYLRGLDADMFLAHHQMAQHLMTGAHQELLARYRFHLAAQEVLKTVSAERARIEAVLKYLSSQENVPAEAYQEAIRHFREARTNLEQALRQAAPLALPVLNNLAAGSSLGYYLLGESLVAEVPANASRLNNDWVNAFYRQLEGAQSRSRRVHVKSLGAILALQERIAGEWRVVFDPLPNPPAEAAIRA
jgi:Zn-dependent protease with chaperone function